MSDLQKPLILAVVSGKGGVGKTMLAVAIAKELSRTRRTLLVDLDFFNRGLTGLLQKCTVLQTIPKPDFLAAVESREASTWELVEVTKNLYHVFYPDLTDQDMRKFESSDVLDLKRSLEAFILSTAAAGACDCVVLDCHGGPDNSSFAACLFAHHTLLISEPDRITFYGTLNFLRQLRKTTDERPLSVFLVFNKVVPAFSSAFLNAFYKRHLREEFSGRPLLAIYPLEVYLTKEFEKTPFLTEVYPNSLLARKTQVLLYDLLRKDHSSWLSARAKSLPRFMRSYRRLTLGKSFIAFDLSFISLLFVVGGVTKVLLELAQESKWVMEVLEKHSMINELYQYLNKNMVDWGVLLVCWLPVVLLLTWSKTLDLKFVYFNRTKKKLSAAGAYLASLLLWSIPLLVLGAIANELRSGPASPVVAGFVFVGTVCASVLLEQVVRTYRGFRYDDHPVENSLRLTFVAYEAIMPCLFYYFLMREA